MSDDAGRQVAAVAVLGESALALAALAWMWVRRLELPVGHPALAVPAGIGVAAVAAATNALVLRYAPPVGPVESLRRVYRDVLHPLFGRLEASEIALVSAAAGVGEELLFRGVLQRELGLVPASLIFGALHWGGRGTAAFALGATGLGFVLGGLMVATGGLLAPIVAHAVYDALALASIRDAERWHRRECDPASSQGTPPRGGDP